MLRLEDVSVLLGEFRLSAGFSVSPGQFVAVIGPSGSGKSTLLSLIAGFQAPAKGRVSWEGVDLTRSDPGDRPVSIVFQDNNLFPHLTARQNVGLGIDPGLRLSKEQWSQVAHALSRVGLDGAVDRRPSELSGGQQSRVALARVLVRDKPLLLLDEPFSALGPALRSEMLDLVKALANETGATVLMVTHDPDDALLVAEETILVDGGRVSPPRPTKPLFDDPPEGLRDYLGT